jgi:hypothetical protein
MDARKLGAAAVRFYALMLVFDFLVAAPQALAWLSFDTSERWMAVATLLSLLMTLAAAAFLLLRTKTVVRWVAPDLEPGAEVEPPQASELGVLAFSLAGLVFVVRGLAWLVQSGARWYFSAEWTRLHTRELTSHDKATVPVAVFMIAIGLWLMLGSSGILRAVQRLQRPPIPDSDPADDPPDSAGA